MFNGGVRGKRAKDGVGFLSTAEQFNQKSFLVPTVTSFSVTDVSYVPLDNTAVDTAGGEIIVINGSGFASGATVQVGATTIGSVTFIDQNRLAFTAPALSSGSYTIYVTNSNGGTGILVSGLVYSGLPTYSTTAGSLGTVYETANINTAVVATGDAPITYSVISGTLPSGATLNSNGTITGNAPVDGSSTTYSFVVQASDAQLQDTTRSFSLTINTDVVTWSTPASGLTSLVANTTMSNVSLSASSAAGYNITYAANTLPTGVSLSGNTIFGTPTTDQTVHTALTATAATTGRSATRFISWSINTVIQPFNFTTFTTLSETTYRTLGVDPVYSHLYTCNGQDPDATLYRYNIAGNGSLSGNTAVTTNTGSVPTRGLSFRPPSSDNAVISGYSSTSYANYTSRGNMFSNPNNINLGAEFPVFNSWGNVYTGPNVLIFSGANSNGFSPYPANEGLVIVNLTNFAAKAVNLANSTDVGQTLTTGLAFDSLTNKLYVGFYQVAGIINVYDVSNPNDYANISFTYSSRITTSMSSSITAIGCNASYIWYGGENQSIRRSGRT